MSSPNQKQARVFLSSTFQDMQEERDALVKLFRQLSHEGRNHGIPITLLDLRWGITNDQKRNGMVITTCLQEIDNSRPYFIGLLGDRYGWVPSDEELEQNPELIRRFPKIKDYSRRGLSITEIEMRHGVLDAPNTERAIFLKKKGMMPENPTHKALLDDIAARSPHQVQLFEYGSMDELTDIVRREFTSMLKKEEEKEVDEHEATKRLQERILSEKAEGYVDFNDYKSQINQWVESNDPELVVTGEPGVGKSSLIASWVSENSHKFDRVIYYSIGEGGEPETTVQIQKYILDELKETYGIDTSEIVEDLLLDDILPEGEYSGELDIALEEMKEKGEKLLLVFDGIDHLRNGGIDKLLVWLPDSHENVKMLHSTNPADLSYNAFLEMRKAPQLEMAPFNKEQTAEVMRNYLSGFGKALEEVFIDKLSENPIFHNGSFLKIMLDDLIAYGNYEDLPFHIINYAEAVDEKDFFNKVLQRAEDYYGEDNVSRLFTLLAISKNGLSESDIIEILGLTPLQWSELYCGLRNYLMFVEGRVNERYPELRDAIFERYEYMEGEPVIDLRNKILETLKGRPEEVDEIAFQAFQFEDWELLYDTLRPLKVMTKLILKSERLLQEYWLALKDQGYSFSVYLEDIRNSSKDELEMAIDNIIRFADGDLNDVELTVGVHEAFISLLDLEDDIDRALAIGYNLSIARIYSKYYHTEKADIYLEKAKEMIEEYEPDDDSLWATYYLDKGSNLYNKGEAEESLEAFQKSLEHHDKFFNEEQQWAVLNRMGISLISLERYGEAIEYFEKALEYVSSLQTSLTLEPSQIINNLGLSYLNLEEYDKAEEYLEKAFRQMEPMFSENNQELFHPVTNLGIAYLRNGKIDEAREKFLQGDNILEANEVTEITRGLYAFVYRYLGLIENEAENYDLAEEWWLKAVKIEEFSEHVADAYFDIGQFYFTNDQFDTALKVYEEVIKRADECFEGANPMSGLAHENLADVYLELEEPKKARKELEKARDIYREIGYDESADNVSEQLESLL